MATVAQLMDMARLQCNKTSSMSWLSNADLLPFLNTFVYARMQEDIRKKVDWEYFTYTYTTNIVDDESKYLLPQADSTTPWVLKIIEVAIKETSTSDYFKVIYEKWTKHVDWFTDYEAVNAVNPYYDKRNGYLYLYPTPTENITDGLKILASVTLPDLETTTVEADIFPNHQQLRQFQNVIVAGLMTQIYWITWDTEMKQITKQEFESELQQMCWSLQKGQEPVYWDVFIWEQYY